MTKTQADHQFLPQGYPLYLAWAERSVIYENPSTENGRKVIARNAGMSNDDLAIRIKIDHVIGWMLREDEFSGLVPVPVTVRGPIADDDLSSSFVDDLSTHFVYGYGRTRDEAVSMAMQDLTDDRDASIRRCERHGIKPS